MSKFKKGQKVIKYLAGGGFTTKEDAVVLEVDKDGVWLDNGNGNDPSGPFDPVNGNGEAPLTGWRSYIEPA
jgi:hypothetical protein